MSAPAVIATASDPSLADSVQENVPSWNSGALPPELTTGHPQLDREHRFLVAAFARLGQLCSDPDAQATCEGCLGSRAAACERSLLALLGDLFAFMLEHFRNEEAVMRESLMRAIVPEICDAHIEDHGAMAAKVQEVVETLDTVHTVARIRELRQLLEGWLKNHIALHGRLLAHWSGRLESPLKGQ